ncbi:MAG: hypothetical protein ACJA17_000940 [Polaribacter sp.]|jgi:hypothetical protein
MFKKKSNILFLLLMHQKISIYPSINKLELTAEIKSKNKCTKI